MWKEREGERVRERVTTLLAHCNCNLNKQIQRLYQKLCTSISYSLIILINAFTNLLMRKQLVKLHTKNYLQAIWQLCLPLGRGGEANQLRWMMGVKLIWCIFQICQTTNVTASAREREGTTEIERGSVGERATLHDGLVGLDLGQTGQTCVANVYKWLWLKCVCERERKRRR